MHKYLFIVYFFLRSANAIAQEEGFLKIVEGQIYYRTFGSGQPILIINGGPGMNSNGFVNLARQLSKNNQTIIYDQRGNGQSTLAKIDTSTLTIKLMIDDIETIRKHLNINKWIVLGHSFGGMLASYYATLYPENIISLILSSSGGIDLELLSYVNKKINACLSKEELKILNECNDLISKGDTGYTTRLRRGTALAPAYLYNRKYIPVIAERLTQGNSQINGLIWNDMQKINFDCTKALSTFNKPVLIIQGKQDIIEEKTAWKAHNALKNSKLVFLDKCSHYGWLDAEAEYFKKINDFIGQR